MVECRGLLHRPGHRHHAHEFLQPGDLLTAIRIPATWAGAQFYFEKVRDRHVWDFPLVNVASAVVTTGGTIDRIRIAVNGVAAHPLRLKEVEDAVSGKPRNEATGEWPANWRLQGAEPLQLQRLQSAADAQPGEARHSAEWRRQRGHNTSGRTSPWGQHVPIHIAWFLIWVAAIAGLLFLIVHAIYVRYFAKPEGVRGRDFRLTVAARVPEQVARHSLARAPVSLDHGAVHVRPAVHRVPAQSGRPVHLGDLPLDRRASF